MSLKTWYSQSYASNWRYSKYVSVDNPDSLDAVYNEAHDAVSAGSVSDDEALFGQILTLDTSPPNTLSAALIRRGLFVFPTFELPLKSTLVSAKMELWMRESHPLHATWHHDFYIRLRHSSLLNGLTENDLDNYSKLITYAMEEGDKLGEWYADDFGYEWTKKTVSFPTSIINRAGVTAFSITHSKDEAGIRPADPTTEPIEAEQFAIRSADPAKLIVTHLAPPSAQIWVGGTWLRWISEVAGACVGIEGTLTGNTGKPSQPWVEGIYLHFIDENGNERRYQGGKSGATGVKKGYIWIEDYVPLPENCILRYIDANGDERWVWGAGDGDYP